MPANKLVKSSHDKKLAGVCGGLAAYFGLDPTLVRVAYLLLCIFSAAFPGLVIYIVLALVLPRDEDT